MRRFGVALAAGILVGGVAALVAGLIFEPFELIGTWGVVDGIATVTGYGTAIPNVPPGSSSISRTVSICTPPRCGAWN